jgi:hypothetical protein
MRVLTLFKPNQNKMPTPTSEHMAKMGQFIEELTKSGVLLATEGRKAGGTNLRVRRSGGEFTVTDGPFTEAKELIGGFALLQVKSKEELIELTKRFLEITGDGESEIIEVFGPSDLAQ